MQCEGVPNVIDEILSHLYFLLALLLLPYACEQ